MTREEFIKVLDEKGYEWREEGEWIIVDEPGYVGLISLESIPDNVRFINRNHVHLNSLKSMENNVEFNNGGNVYLESLKSMGDNAQFNNGGFVNLRSLESIPGNVQFNNGGSVYFDSLESIPINVDHYEMFPGCKDIRIKFKWMDLEKNMSFPNSRWESVNTGRVQMYESWIKNIY